MSEVALWQLIRDWLPTAGWEILQVREPTVYQAVSQPGPVGVTPIPAFIVANVEEHKHIRGPNQDHPYDKMCMIKDNEVLFFDKGMWDYSLKASDPDFFDKLDSILMTLFHKAEWWQIKTGRTFVGRREKIWPK